MTRKKIINILEDKLEINKNLGIRESIIRFKTLEINKNLGIRESIIRFKTTDISDLLHQLKDCKALRVELEKNSKELEDAKSVAEFQQKCNIERGFRVKELEKELEVYKKALELACWDTMCNCLHEDYYNDLLQKAREEV